jgi:hypothetical protein
MEGRLFRLNSICQLGDPPGTLLFLNARYLGTAWSLVLLVRSSHSNKNDKPTNYSSLDKLK